MTYKDQFVVDVKYNGRILRVRDDFVYLPFGSEYSLFFKNVNSRRAAVKVSIDGQDVLDSKSLILDANESTELQGFMNGNQVRNRFRFIQKTQEIQNHRGDKIDDGFIRVEFSFEKPKPEVKKTIIHEYHHHSSYHPPYYWNYNDWFTGNSSDKYSETLCSSPVRGLTGQASEPQAVFASCSVGVENQNQPLADEGITVKGSKMLEEYRYVSIGELEQSSVIIIRLKGFDEKSNKPVQQAMSVSEKLTCSSCGKKSTSSNKYCPNCGTYLE